MLSAKPLAGQRIGIIGPTNRRQDYTKAIEELGAEVEFAASEEKFGQIGRMCNRCQIILFVTTRAKHRAEFQLTDAKRRGVRVEYVNYKGVDRLRQAALTSVI